MGGNVYGIFGGSAGSFKKKKTYIDNSTFQLHYRVTFGILVICSVLVSLVQFFGSPIRCIVQGVPASVMNTYCWISGTFTIPSQLAGRIGDDIPHPGVAPLTHSSDEKGHIGWDENGDEMRHAWYQWVCFILSFQALLCYVPHYIWKACEGGKLSMLIQGLDGNTLKESEEFSDRRVAIVKYFLRTNKTHNSYAFKFVFCEFLNLFNVLFQIFLMNVFFNGQFSQYGLDVINVSETEIEDRVDPLNRVFPKVTKCIFHKYGQSGTIEIKDGLCVLALNIINEKIYILIWFWFIFISIWTAIHLMVRVVALVSSYCRYLLLCHRCKSVNRRDVHTVLSKCGYGDWFILMQMCKHINPSLVHDIIIDLRDKIDQKRAANAD